MNKNFIKRAGVIPFTVINDEGGRESVKCLFAEHRETGELSDFGGGVKKNETLFEAAKRELSEESNNIFVLGDEKDHPKCELYGKDTIIYFIPIPSSFYKNVRNNFKASKENREVKDIVWVDLRSMLEGNRTNFIWSKIFKIIKYNRHEITHEKLKALYKT